MKNDFLRGFSGVLELYPEDRNISINIPNQSDQDAIRSDFEQVGQDIYNAMESLNIK